MLDSVAVADKQAIGDQPQRDDIDLAAALVDQLHEAAVDVGVFADAFGGTLLAVDEQLRAAAFEAHFHAVGSADIDGPFLALGAAPIEAAIEGAVGGVTGELDLGG